MGTWWRAGKYFSLFGEKEENCVREFARGVKSNFKNPHNFSSFLSAFDFSAWRDVEF